jgi:hypothetical protein
MALELKEISLGDVSLVNGFFCHFDGALQGALFSSRMLLLVL